MLIQDVANRIHENRKKEKSFYDQIFCHTAKNQGSKKIEINLNKANNDYENLSSGMSTNELKIQMIEKFDFEADSNEAAQ